ncbi:MAG: hypothetical protein LBR11_12250, partial [Deltaproteobacteria bacterium]|nr:hypothetical protein [Deltaproteobacteria bacterium]
MPDNNDTVQKTKSQNIFLVSDALDFALSDPETKKRTFKGVAYSGEPVRDHFLYDAVIFDLAGVKFSHKKMPILLDHNSEKIVGFATNISKDTGKIIVEGVLLDSSDSARKVASLADEGYPWQMSVNITPEEFQILRSDEKAVVNGKEFRGPMDIFRKS